VAAPTATSLATLLSRHILRDGEVVILLLKPSPLFIALTSIRFIAVVALLVTAIFLFDINDRFQWNTVAVIEGGIFIVAGRLMWAVLQWMARLYVLTDLRVLRISGVFNVHIFDCALRKVARTRVLQSTRDRLLGVGSIEIIPVDDNEPEGVWQTIAKPRMVHEQVVATINKAKQGGSL
jgi:Bacterial PH domain